MKPILLKFLSFMLLGILFTQCDEDPQSKITGKVIDQSQCKNFLAGNNEKFTVSDTFSSVEYNYILSLHRLTLNHINAAFNCCPDEIYCQIEIVGDTIHIYELEETSACDCNCLYDITEQLNNVLPGTYTIQYHEPYIGNQPALIFQLQLSEDCSGIFSVPRTSYPWGIL